MQFSPLGLKPLILLEIGEFTRSWSHDRVHSIVHAIQEIDFYTKYTHTMIVDPSSLYTLVQDV